MSEISRRDALKQLGSGAASLTGSGLIPRLAGAEPLIVAGEPAELTVSAVSRVTVRLTLRAVRAAPSRLAQRVRWYRTTSPS